MHPDIRALCDSLTLRPDGRFLLGPGAGTTPWPAGVHFEGREVAADQPLATDDDTSVPPSGTTVEEPAREPALDTAGTAMAGVLTAFLYEHFYVRPRPQERPRTDIVGTRDFQHALVRATPQDPAWQAGFTFAGTGGTGVVVTRGPLRFTARPGSVRPMDGPASGEALQPGGACAVRLGRQYRWRSPGFHLVVGRTLAPDSGGAVARLYWHLRASDAPTFLRAAVGRLDREDLPFTLKVLNSPDLYGRADAGVLYLRIADCARAAPALLALHAAHRSRLREEVPRFTKRLAAGLGLAEAPGDGESFGLHRCRAVAHGVALAYTRGQRDAHSRVAAVARALHQHGIPLDRPYLSLESVDDLAELGDAFTSRSEPHRPVKSPPVPGHRGPPSSEPTTVATRGLEDAVSLTADPRDELLGAARTVGDRLCASALWDDAERRCTWVGRANPTTATPWENAEPVAGPVGASLYGGTSGIGLFLAELYGVSGNTTHADTARGAFAAAALQPSTVGLYTGHGGQAVAQGLAFHALGGRDIDPQAEGRALVQALEHGGATGVDDLLGGRAGTILGLLALARLGTLPRSIALEHARRLGDALAGAGISAWRRPGNEPLLLTGLSHGACGIGLALLELHAATGVARFRAVGREAFDYEDRLFDASRLNWPDLRQHAGAVDGPQGDEPRFGLAWCHGAPGIALARLRAAELDEGWRDRHLEAADAALTTTARTVDELLRTPQDLASTDMSLCHGLAGLMDIVWSGGLALDDLGMRELARRAGLAVAHGVTSGNQLRSGTVCGGPSPSLMLGDAGVGHALLRLYAPSVPSVLLVR
jgi:Lanthionine synthetase C-like protein/HopA1 effector protein family